MADEASPKNATMLVSFRAENVRSFRDPVELSMEATAVAEPDVPRELPWRRDGRTTVRVLPVAALFGANASGKTNLLQVVDDMRRLVLTSFAGRRRSGKQRVTRFPFKLDPECKERPSRYEVEVIIDGIRHEYGFVVDDTRVLDEWAVHYPRGKAATILRRSGNDISFRSKSGRDALEGITRPDSLALSAASAIGLHELTPLNDWFDRNLLLCSESSRHNRWNYTSGMFTDPEMRQKVLEFMQIADLGITDIRTRKPDPEMLERLQKLLGNLAESEDHAEPFVIDPESMVRFFMSHRGHGGDVELESFEESQGTLVWFGIAGPVLSVLADGAVMLADELESSLHPALVAEIVKMFQNKESNPNNAQLIFNSHEARLLGNSESDRVLGRDQAWFVEKSNAGDSRIYPLTDLNPRKSEAVARRYLEGRYGATPILSGAEFRALAADTARG